MPLLPALEREKQVDLHEFQSRLGYKIRSGQHTHAHTHGRGRKRDKEIEKQR